MQVYIIQKPVTVGIDEVEEHQPGRQIYQITGVQQIRILIGFKRKRVFILVEIKLWLQSWNGKSDEIVP